MWSNWQDIEQAKVKERGQFGIYQIRMVGEAGSPLPVQRIGDIDAEGIIYIGRAVPNNTLAKRIGQFNSVSHLKNASHHGAETYVLMSFALRYLGHAYSNHKLEYRVARLNADANRKASAEQESFKQRVKDSEVKILAEYFYKFGELPPCNSSFPGKWHSFKEKLQNLHAKR